MSVWDYLRDKLRSKRAKQKLEVVETCEHDYKMAADSQAIDLNRKLLKEIDFSYRGDLEAYVKGLNVSKEVVQSWISAGLLYPEEMVVAEKIIKIMIKNEQADHL